jgi:hypothetical protein
MVCRFLFTFPLSNNFTEMGPSIVHYKCLEGGDSPSSTVCEFIFVCCSFINCLLILKYISTYKAPSSGQSMPPLPPLPALTPAPVTVPTPTPSPTPAVTTPTTIPTPSSTPAPAPTPVPAAPEPAPVKGIDFYFIL